MFFFDLLPELPLAVSALSPAFSLHRSPCCLINKLRPLWFWSMRLVCLGPVTLSSTLARCLLLLLLFFGGEGDFRSVTTILLIKTFLRSLPSFTWTKISCLPPSVSGYNCTHRCNLTVTHMHMKARSHTLYFRSIICPWLQASEINDTPSECKLSLSLSPSSSLVLFEMRGLQFLNELMVYYKCICGSAAKLH